MSNVRFEAIIDPYLPWDPLPGEARRIRTLLGVFLGIAVLWMIVQPHIKIPVQSRAQAEAVPERLATLVLEEKQKPPPPPAKETNEELKKPDETKPKEEKKEAPPPVETQEPKAVQTDAKTAAARARAKQEIQNAGLDQLSDLRDMSFDDQPPKAGLPDQTGPGTGGLITDTQAAGTSRSLLTSRAGTGSGGLAAAGYGGGVSSGFGGGAAGGKGSKGGANGFGLGNGSGKMTGVQSKVASDLALATNKKVGASGKAMRSQESVNKGFDVIGGKLNQAYQKALRDNPTEQGGVTLKLSIAPDGSVTSCSIASTELNDPAVEGRICTITKGFNFGADDVDPWSGKYTINFLPGG